MHFSFALTALAAAGEALFAGWRYHPGSAEQLVTLVKWSGSCQFSFGLFVVWFLHYYGDTPRRIGPLVLTGMTVVVIVLHATYPYGLTFSEAPELRLVRLPWGEEIVAPLAKPTRALLFAHLTSGSLVGYVVYGLWGMWKSEQRKQAMWLAFAYAPLVLIAWPYGLFVNRGILPPPFLYSFAFLTPVLFMSVRLVGKITRSASLARQVEAQNTRWSSLLDNVQLLVAGYTDEGVLNYVNPCYLETTGYTMEEALGRNVNTVVEARGRQSTEAPMLLSPDGARAGHFDSTLRTKEGGQRMVRWSTVRLLDEHGRPEGGLSIGSDYTEQQLAEKARDEAFRQLQVLAARLEGENLYLKEGTGVRDVEHRIVGESPGIRYVIQQIQLVAKTKASVLIEGETGVGKELVARAIHDLSDRKQNAFIGVNCAAISPTLVEAELFGAEKGAYTGADRLRKGRFELADGGTLFLDEVGELSLDLQVKLLRVLQEEEFERVGGQQTKRVDVRIIAATNRNLRAEIAAGRFREDLYYRLGVYPITVPPLRKRREDIPLLVEYLVGGIAARHEKQITEVPGHAMKLLEEWDWPGNVRELANIIERAVILTEGPVLKLPSDFMRQTSGNGHRAMQSYSSLAEIERKHILEVLEHTAWRISGPGGAAETLGMHPNTLRSRMAKIGISKRAGEAEN